MKIDKALIWIAVIAIHIGVIGIFVISHRKHTAPKQPPAQKLEMTQQPIPPVLPEGNDQPQPTTGNGSGAQKTPSNSTTTTPATPTQSAKPIQPAVQPTQPARPTPPPVAARPASSPAGMPGKYHSGFYSKANKKLPKALEPYAKDCRAAVVLDVNSHTILWEKNATAVNPIASLSKLMTAQMLLDRIAADSSLTLQSTIKITNDDFKRTRLKPLNSVYLGINEEYTLQEYLKAMLISSANDCAYIVGKFLGGGDLNVFVAAMNSHANELGLNDMKFINPHGLPVGSGPTRTENMGSAIDIAYLAERSMHYPEIMKWAGTPADRIREDKKNPFDLNSTNKLLRGKVDGVNGIKTGYTATAGFCIAITCERNGRKVIVVVMGVQGNDHGARRDTIARKLLEWAYQDA